MKFDRTKIVKLLIGIVVTVVIYIVSFYFLVISQLAFSPGMEGFMESFYAPVIYTMKAPELVSTKLSGYVVKSQNFDLTYTDYTNNTGLESIYLSLPDNYWYGDYVPAANSKYLINEKEVSEKEFIKAALYSQSSDCDEMGRPDLFEKCNLEMFLGGFKLPKSDDFETREVSFTKAELKTYLR